MRNRRMRRLESAVAKPDQRKDADLPERDNNVWNFDREPVLSAECCGGKMKYLRIKWWIYLPVYIYRGILRRRGKFDPDEPMLPEWMTSDEKQAICHEMYKNNILI